VDSPGFWNAARDLAPQAAVVLSGGALLLAAASLAVSLRKGRPRLPAAVSPPAPAWSGAYFDAVLKWADRACRELTWAIHLAESRSDADRERKLGEIRASLSHLIDTGYWFLPNAGSDRPEPDHPPAYRGIRHPALDLLVAARGLVGQTDPVGVAALVRAKREFVSHIQALLNPNQRERGIAGVLDRFAAVPEEDPGRIG
jgi:hypothetical protein